MKTEFNELKFDEKLDFFSTRRVTAAIFCPEPFKVRYIGRIGGRNVSLGRDNRTKPEAIQEARDYKKQCVDFARGTVQAKLYDEKMVNRNKPTPSE